ncbi:uncharacterized protein B0T15DRAFT_539664 [Chaetomium strumarium]|uniref:Uncharacterized protein n=1 Tax=Chaetomium strumarium TaxID=1170767 RepID=A0AAJ0GNN2_9PEZI|nr:hypothetical protein B0T15DRAFT_539664 [Chaetomium strumarium]
MCFNLVVVTCVVVDWFSCINYSRPVPHLSHSFRRMRLCIVVMQSRSQEPSSAPPLNSTTWLLKMTRKQAGTGMHIPLVADRYQSRGH